MWTGWLWMAALAAAGLPWTAEARTKLVALPERESVSVRFDNPAATLLEEERVLALQDGENLVDFSWRGVSIDPDSIRLSVSRPDEVKLLSVSYPPGEAALVWRLFSKGAREERVRIAYLLASIDRLVAYKGLASKNEKELDLEGYLILRNFSGEDLERVTVTLGQGDSFTGRAANEETRQIHVLSAKKIPVRKTFTWDASRLPWEPKRLDTNVGLPVHYIVENSRAGGLGKDRLWAGKVRIFQDDGRGGTVFLGEDWSDTVAVGEEMRIYIGDSREVMVTQRKTRDSAINHRPSRQYTVLYDTDEVIEAEVESFKDEDITVDLVEQIPGEWDMEETSMPYEKQDANTLVFRVKVPAKGKQQVRYHYHRRNVRQ